MKVAIIGFGKMGMLHGSLLSSMPGVEIVSVCDKSRLLLRAFKSIMPNTRFYDDYGRMLDEITPDAVVVTTPTFSHSGISIDLARRRIPFFIEKPLATTHETALMVQEEAEKSGVKGMVGFCCRNMSTFGRVREMINDDRIGRVSGVKAFMFTSDVMRKEKGWRFNKELSGGGVVMDYSIHMLDMMKWIFGDIESVAATTRKIYSEMVEDEMDAAITFKSGVVAVFQSSWSNPDYRKTYMKMEIAGELGTIDATDQTLELKLVGGPGEKLSYPDLYKGYFVDIAGPMFSVQMDRFHDMITHGSPVESDIANGVAVQKLVDLIYRSSAGGGAKIDFDSGDAS